MNECRNCIHWVILKVGCEAFMKRGRPADKDYCLSHGKPYWRSKWKRAFHSLKELNERIDFIKEEEMRL
jgi:hypothetical protein